MSKYKVGEELINIEIEKLEKETEGNNLYFAKLREDVIIPIKDSENAGYDIYANFREDYFLIKPHQTVMIPTGICSAFGEDWVVILKERGSTGTKGMAQKCGVIDSNFRGAWFCPITNTTEKPLYIIKKEALCDVKEELNDKYEALLQNTETQLEDHFIFYPYEKAISQAIVLPVPKMNIQEISLDKLKAIPSKRGEGMLGSSGK